MADKKKILIQLDCDPLPSVFDRVVAVDAGAEEIFSYGGISGDAVRDLVYGAIFTRGAEDLRRTAVFIGGSDVPTGEELLKAARKAFLGPLSVSLMLDCAGANTTAAAAALVAARQGELRDRQTLVLASTGPVGQRVTRLLARQGARVRASSRSSSRAEVVAERVRAAVEGAHVEPVGIQDAADLEKALEGVEVVISAGGAGVCLLPEDVRLKAKSLRLAIDLNAVPPGGIEGIKPTDAGKDRGGVVGYGAIGVGGLKMKIHKAAVARLFEANDQVLDADEIFDLGVGID
jgi:hypothetical protein